MIVISDRLDLQAAFGLHPNKLNDQSSIDLDRNGGGTCQKVMFRTDYNILD